MSRPQPAGVLSRRSLLAAGGASLMLTGDQPPGAPAGEKTLASASFGARVGNIPYPDLSAFYALEGLLDRSLNEMSWFMDWSTGWKSRQAQEAAARGKDIVLGWTAQIGEQPVPFADILDGRYDAYLADFLTAAGRFPRRLRIRPFHEMNGQWYPWSLASPDPAVHSLEQWQAAWQYLVQMGRSLAPTIEWVWCVNYVDYGGPALEEYYPGADLIDVLGIDAYNGPAIPGSPWMPASEAVLPVYERVARLNSHAPIAICEIGSREPRPDEGYDKGLWIRDLLALSAPRISDVNFFSKREWALDTSRSSLAAARTIRSA